MSAWPTDLPPPHVNGYSVAPDNAFIRTEMDSGPARQRQRFTAVPTMVSAGWRFTPEQMVTFREYFKTDINHGTDWFQMDLDIGDGSATYDVRFTEPWQAGRMPGGVWDVTARLEVRFA